MYTYECVCMFEKTYAHLVIKLLYRYFESQDANMEPEIDAVLLSKHYFLLKITCTISAFIPYHSHPLQI